MRSARPSSCPCHRRGPAHGFLPAVAGIIDQATLAEPGHVLVHVDGPVHPDVRLGFKTIGDDRHPFEVLAGFTAPETWSAFAIRARGNARHLDQPEAPPERTAVTFLVDRAGDEASVLRMGHSVTEPAGPAVGTIPDLARRVLGVATEAAPASTAPLWTAMWLDRVLERWCQPERRRDLTSSWGQIAVLHPAIHAPSAPDVVAFADPASLVSVARSHAAATSWAELRGLAVAAGPSRRSARA